MSDTTNRQAYVFLDTSDDSNDYTTDVDECFNSDGDWIKTGEGEWAAKFRTVRRPITLPTEQTDKLTVWDEYAKSSLEGILANSSEQSTFHSTIGLATEYADAMMKARSGK